LDAFELAHDAIAEGAIGVDMGRNIWQSEHPVAMITAIREIVHNGVSVREATHTFEEAKKTKTPVLAKTPVR
jgi:putative autoinducer-2 (AI-2) aldolase